MENLRKEHAKDVERVKSEHESESKNVMLLLQRQNVSLESKTEKLQSHLKTMETRMKELMNTIDVKNKTIAERDELRAKIEAENQVFHYARLQMSRPITHCCDYSYSHLEKNRGDGRKNNKDYSRKGATSTQGHSTEFACKGGGRKLH